MAKLGSVLVLTDEKEAAQHGVDIPKRIELWVYAGANGSFELIEEDKHCLMVSPKEYLFKDGLQLKTQNGKGLTLAGNNKAKHVFDRPDFMELEYKKKLIFITALNEANFLI